MTDKTIEFLEKGPDTQARHKLRMDAFQEFMERVNRNLFIIACLSLVSTLLLTWAFAFCWSRAECRCQRAVSDVRFVEGGGR